MTTAWPEVALGDVVQLLAGFAFDAARFSDDGGTPLIRIRDLTRGRTDTFFDGNYDKRYEIVDGEILIGMDGQFNRARWTGGPALLNQRVCKITAKGASLDDGYLFHFLPQALKAVEDETPFVTVKHLSMTKLKAIKIPLPPLEEQRRIAAILDKADEVRTKRKAALETLETLSQAIFIEMFGDPVANPMGWPVMMLGKLAEFLDNQRKPITARDRIPGPIPYYGANGQQDSVADFIFDEPLLLLAEDGGYFDQPERGVAYAIQGKSWVNNHAHVLRPKDEVTLPFLAESLRTRDLSELLTGSTRAKLTKAGAMRIPVAVPPFDQQNAYSDARRRIGLAGEITAAGVEAMDELFASLQQRAFQGAL